MHIGGACRRLTLVPGLNRERVLLVLVFKVELSIQGDVASVSLNGEEV